MGKGGRRSRLGGGPFACIAEEVDSKSQIPNLEPAAGTVSSRGHPRALPCPSCWGASPTQHFVTLQGDMEFTLELGDLRDLHTDGAARGKGDRPGKIAERPLSV